MAKIRVKVTEESKTIISVIAKETQDTLTDWIVALGEDVKDGKPICILTDSGEGFIIPFNVYNNKIISLTEVK